MKLSRMMHRWLGLLIVIQVLIWSLSGLMMALLPEEEVSGGHYLQHPSATGELTPGVLEAYAAFLDSRLPEPASESSTSITLERLAGQWLVALNQGADIRRYYSLESGLPVPVDESFIRRRTAEILGDGAEILLVGMIEKKSRAFEGELPVWKVVVDNQPRSHLYFDPETGELLAHRTALWRWYQFSHDLHTFNFGEEATVNNPLLAVFAIMLFATAVSGAVLLAASISRSSVRKSD